MKAKINNSMYFYQIEFTAEALEELKNFFDLAANTIREVPDIRFSVTENGARVEMWLKKKKTRNQNHVVSNKQKQR